MSFTITQIKSRGPRLKLVMGSYLSASQGSERTLVSVYARQKIMVQLVKLITLYSPVDDNDNITVNTFRNITICFLEANVGTA